MHYRALEEALAEAPVPVQRLVFAVGSTGDGLHVMQVWGSRAALEVDDRPWLAPALTHLDARGCPHPPIVRDCVSHDLHIRRPS